MRTDCTRDRQKTVKFSPQGGTSWAVKIDGTYAGTVDTGDTVEMAEDGTCDMEAVEAEIRLQLSIPDDIICPKYPY